MAVRFLESLLRRISGKTLDVEQIEEALLQADLGLPTTRKIIEALERQHGARDVEGVMRSARAVIRALFDQTPPEPAPRDPGPAVVLVVGVNGTGKTTTVAKLAHRLSAAGHSVMLAPADTFRAGAIEQLAHWARTLHLPVAPSAYQRDPAAVCHEALTAARRDGVDFLLCDTAGRQHTRANLMQQLVKVRRAIAKIDPAAPHECLLVIDASTGGNALVQAREFHEALGLTGVVLTKLDGSGKGGAIVAIRDQLGIPTRYIGHGERVTDLQPFDPGRFVEERI